MKLKYIRLPEYNQILVFPEIIKHDQFKSLGPVSAGFCWIDCLNRKVVCVGESVSLGLKSDEKDSAYATKQFFGDY